LKSKKYKSKSTSYKKYKQRPKYKPVKRYKSVKRYYKAPKRYKARSKSTAPRKRAAAPRKVIAPKLQRDVYRGPGGKGRGSSAIRMDGGNLCSWRPDACEPSDQTLGEWLSEYRGAAEEMATVGAWTSWAGTFLMGGCVAAASVPPAGVGCAALARSITFIGAGWQLAGNSMVAADDCVNGRAGCMRANFQVAVDVLNLVGPIGANEIGRFIVRNPRLDDWLRRNLT
jgi:hypothetical protein